MSAKTDQIMRRLASSIREGSKPKTSPYDTTATVRRVEGGTAWVHIPGGVDETPVKLTISAKPGDAVQVRVTGGRAFLTGNATAPPTDDTTAQKAVAQVGTVSKIVQTVKGVAERTARIAGNTAQYFWHTETGTDTGVHITEIPQDEFLADPENGGGNLLARSNGVAVRDGLVELATFSADGMHVSSFDSNGNEIPVAHLGYGEGETASGSTTDAPYYSLGVRKQNSAIGNYSVAEGYDTTAKGWCSHASGNNTTANEANQAVFGRYNNPVTGDLFEVGNGTAGNLQNAFRVTTFGDAVASRDMYARYVYADTKTDTPTIRRDDGGTISNQHIARSANIVSLIFEVTYNTSVAAGGNLFEGNIATPYRPKYTAMGCSYYGSHALIAKINSAGDIVVRNASATAITLENTAIFSITYFLP